jgi:hypothetical protein
MLTFVVSKAVRHRNTIETMIEKMEADVMRRTLWISCFLVATAGLLVVGVSSGTGTEKGSGSKSENGATDKSAASIEPIQLAPLVFGNPQHNAEYGPARRWALDQWTRKEIETLFDNMQRDGVTLILLPMCFGDESYYPSKILKNKLDYDAYAMLFACWEYQNYLNPRSPLPGAAELSRDYRAHFKIR